MKLNRFVETDSSAMTYTPPLEVEERDGGSNWIDPAKYPEAFMKALPRAISGTRLAAVPRDDVTASLEVPVYVD